MVLLGPAGYHMCARVLNQNDLAQAAMSFPCQGSTLLPSLLIWSLLAFTASRIDPYHFNFPEPPKHKLEEGKKKPRMLLPLMHVSRGEPVFRGWFETLLNYHFLSIKKNYTQTLFAKTMHIIKHAQEMYNYAKLNCMAASLWP